MDNDPVIESVECPRCGTNQFNIEVHIYQACSDSWVVCPNCDWNMGEIKVNQGVQCKRNA